MKIPIIAIVGPTAVGKTELSIKLAKKFNCQIVSIDSVQIYKKFDIGSAKVMKEEMDGVVHHLIDELEPVDTCSVYDFQKKARKKIEQIHKAGQIPLLIGGTGFYMNAVLNDYNFSTQDEKKEVDVEYAKQYLEENYPETYKAIDLSNDRRIINAYNYVINEGRATTENNNGNELYPLYDPFLIVLNTERKEVYARINARVQKMFDLGLEEEVRSIVETYGTNIQALSAIGYKEMLPYINGDITKEMAIENISKNSRHYAKRQLTWFRNKMNGTWYDTMDANIFNKISDDIEKFLVGDNVESN